MSSPKPPVGLGVSREQGFRLGSKTCLAWFFDTLRKTKTERGINAVKTSKRVSPIDFISE